MLTMHTHTMLFRPAFHPVMPVKNFDLTQLSVLVVEKHSPMRSMFRGILRELGIIKLMTPLVLKRGSRNSTTGPPTSF